MTTCSLRLDAKASSGSKVPPFLKWAGGKRWLVSRGLIPPQEGRRFVEPFLGSGAAFFHSNPNRALLCDINHELINLYLAIRNEPATITDLLHVHQENHCEVYYYRMRSIKLNDPVEQAARMLYLNRTCWNGLYRVNQRGEFNVPVGTKSKVVIEGESMHAYAAVLAKAEIKSQDFENTIDACGPDDFIFADPPYTVKHNNNGFVKYNEKIFSWDDQIRLHDALLRACNRGSKVFVTNADHPSVIDLYKDDFSYTSITRSSILAGLTTARSMTSEAIFTANLEDF